MNTQELAEQTAKSIYDALALFYSSGGYFDTTVKDIIRKALDQEREGTIKESEEWMRKQKVWDYYNDCESNFVNDEDVIKYHQYMYKKEEE